jgi:UDP-glucose 4-epimerase
VLVTGGAGFIGTHVLVALCGQGYRCITIDNYSNSSPAALDRVRRITGHRFESIEADLRDAPRIRKALRGRGIDAAIHLAGLKSVTESIDSPLMYYDNNVNGSTSLLEALQDSGVRRVVFSSSATVYGIAQKMPVDESAATIPQSPYGRTKLMVEQILSDQARADATWRIASLRYFNPVGAHESGLIGENPAGVPNNLMPLVCQVAAGVRDTLHIYGTDYPTPDGTGVRDFIHVMDLAEGHLSALRALDAADGGTALTINLGTGRGHSVLELVECFERVNGIQLRCQRVGRRQGDVAACYADAAVAQRLLSWRARRSLEDMCRDAWRWQQANPAGYG